MTRYRLLQVCGTAEGGSWFVDQVGELVRRGHLVHCVVPGVGSVRDRLRELGVPVTVVPFRGYQLRDLGRLLLAQRQLRRLIRTGGFDLVHAHLYKTAVVCRLAVRGRSRPALLSQMPGVVHLQSPVLSAIDKVTMRWDDALVASCHDFAAQYRARGASDVRVNHYGFHAKRLDPEAASWPFRSEQQIRDGQMAIGMVAHMYPTRLQAFQEVGVKGHETFIDAAAELVSRGSTAQFFVVGDEFVGNGSYRAALELRAAERGLAGHLRFLGHRTDMERVLAGLDLLVNPSVSESASYTMMEASLMRKAVVASRVGGLVDTVLDGVSGTTVPPRDGVALADAIEILSNDAPLRERYGRAGREHVLANFDITVTVTGLERIYDSLLGSVA